MLDTLKNNKRHYFLRYFLSAWRRYSLHASYKVRTFVIFNAIYSFGFAFLFVTNRW